VLPAIIVPNVQKEWPNAMAQSFASFELRTDESYLQLNFDFIVRLIVRDDAPESNIGKLVLASKYFSVAPETLI